MMKTKSREDLMRQIERMSDISRQMCGKGFYCGVCDSNNDIPHANKVWEIFGRYQRNIVRALGREPEPKKFPFRNSEECNMQFPASVYAKQ